MISQRWSGDNESSLCLIVFEAAGLSLHLAGWAACVAGCGPVPAGWATLASRLALEYDAVLDYHPQYRGYTPGTQATYCSTVRLN